MKKNQQLNFLANANKTYSEYGFNVMICSLIVIILVGLCFIIPFWGFLLSFVVMACLCLGLKNNTISIFKGEVKSYENLFSFFKTALTSVLLKLVSVIMVAIWTLCFIVPGVVMGLNLFFVEYIHADEKLSIGECIEKSKKLVYGNRLTLLVLILSFLLITCVAIGASVGIVLVIDYFAQIVMWLKVTVCVGLSLIALVVFIIPYYETIFTSMYISLSEKNITNVKQKNSKSSSVKA